MPASPKKKPPTHEILNHRKGRLTLPDGTVLAPGANRATPEQIRMLRTTELMQQWLKRGVISIREKVEPGSVEYDLALGLPASIVGLAHETIQQAVAKCDSKDQLFKWLEGASDDEIRTLITDRAYQLTFDEAANLPDSI